MEGRVAQHHFSAFQNSADDLLCVLSWMSSRSCGRFRGVWSWTVLGLIWALAIFGIIMKVTRGTSRHSRLGLSLYLGMGWLPLIAIGPLAFAIPPPALFWLVAGGIAYTTGVLFFVNNRLRYAHLVWHLFVLVGTSCHFLALLGCTN